MCDDFAQASEIIPGRFFFTCLRRPDSLRTSHIAATSICYSIDDELLFDPFFADFGPLSLGKAYRYCRKTQNLLVEADRSKKRLYFYCGPHVHHRANAAVLVGMYQVLYMNRSADEAFKPLQAFKPFVPFRDASCGVSSFHLTVLDCLKGIQKARDVGFIDWNSGNSTWSHDEYEHYEQVENGDLNWIVPGKLLAFSGPATRNNEVPGYRLFTPEDYIDYFKQRNVTAVVRLNKKIYEKRRFTDNGVRHYELYFPDGSCPSEAIILKFLEIAESEPGALAVHCKAGLGRTGVLICCFMMKHYRFTAEECIGYIRIARPGSVIGPQQNFLRDVEARMWQEGDLHRAKKGGSRTGANVGLGAHDMAVSGRPAVSASDLHDLHSSHYVAPQSSGQAYRGVGPTFASYSTPGSRGQYSLSSASPSPSDMSLLQYKQYNPNSMPVPGHYTSAPTSPAGQLGGVNRITGTPSRSHAGRSITPMKYGGASAGGYGYGQSILTSQQGYGAGRSPGLSSRQGPGSDVSRSSPAALRSPSTDRITDRAQDLRTTLHTSTLQAADRPRTIVERNLQSADMSAVGLRGNGIAIGAMMASAGSRVAPTSAGGMLSGHKSDAAAGYTRTLAPNGQPRKVPMSTLQQYHASLSNGRNSAPNLQAMRNPGIHGR